MKSRSKSPAQLRAMKLGQQIRTIRGCCTQLDNVATELGSPRGSLIQQELDEIKNDLEERARKQYETAVNKL